ncbi:hypothetical protein LGN19_36000 [Burkholderia sp. AU30198]|uniref:hypothetical protein n=1 Tax=Burkholderia sp. AU30198 TaxID=2879627 RepID=UPI001CF5B60A|nr:hypothetical protein [Burkholderia sp. AU30198]MCA8299194.1 hypothetical protein [Burkholderia sp. AU30198]
MGKEIALNAFSIDRRSGLPARRLGAVFGRSITSLSHQRYRLAFATTFTRELFDGPFIADVPGVYAVYHVRFRASAPAAATAADMAHAAPLHS